MVDQKRRDYDTAQKLGENIEVMAATKGWTDHLIPEIQKRRDESQAHINSVETELRIADYHRGMMRAYDYILQYEKQKTEAATSIMRKNVNGVLRDDGV